MPTTEMTEQLRLLQQEVQLAGEAVETLQRDHRAAIDALRLEVEVIRRCLLLAYPDLQEHEDEIRSTVIRETDPEQL